MHRYIRFVFGVLLITLTVTLVLWTPSGEQTDQMRRSQQGQEHASVDNRMIEVGELVTPVLTGAARELPPFSAEPTLDREINPRLAVDGHTGSDLRFAGRSDPLLTRQAESPMPSDSTFSTPLLSFAGRGYTFVNPPDTVGDVGRDYYVQMVNGSNTAVSIYDKTDGSLVTSFGMTGLGACATGSGDPVVLYDQSAERWLLSEFGPGNSLCVFISQTPDPTGAYYAYQFSTPSFPDYPKYAVWPDAYYVSTNEANPASYALDRNNMLAGNPATSQRFIAPALNGFGFQALTPTDLDGSTLPPVDSPGYFVRHRDDEVHNASTNDPTEDYLEIWAFDVDWNAPGNSSFSQIASVPIAEFDSDLCGYTSYNAIAQPGAAKCSSSSLDPLREVVMFRSAYRNMGSHEAMIGNFVTDVTGNDDAGVRWYELRRIDGIWSLYQEGTYAPDGDSRWMGAIAMDGVGNMALGYNVSSSSTYPSLRYAGRLATDPSGTLPQGEYAIVAGSAKNSSNRYGDYSAMSIDPVDDCTFWFTGEYNASSNWSTQIAAFRFDTCKPVIESVCSPDTVSKTVFLDDFESGAAGWTHASDLGPDTWALSSNTAHSGSMAFHVEDVPVLSDQYLVSPAIALPTAQSPVTLSFQHVFSIEDGQSSLCFDGAVLEISADNGTNWSRLDDELISQPYNGIISEEYDNPLAGQSAWCGSESDWMRSVVNLNDFVGQTVRLRFRLATDSSIGSPTWTGWTIDDVHVQSCATLSEYVYLPMVIMD